MTVHFGALLLLLTVQHLMVNCDVDSDALAFVQQFNATAEIAYNLDTEAVYAYYVNVTDANANAAALADAALSQFLLTQAAVAINYDLNKIRLAFIETDIF